jgi:hypothetical protein
VGGGRYGTKAARYLIARGISCVIVDPDPGCPAIDVIREMDNGSFFVRGGLEEALRIFIRYRPVRVFPTAPLHVAAGLVSLAHGLRESPAGLQFLLSRFPPHLVQGMKGGSLYLSRNRDGLCIPDCPEPDTCPVTGGPRSIPLSSELRILLPEAHILESLQVAPGLGALRGGDVDALLALNTSREKVVVGTACRCHGVVTILDKDPGPGCS